MTMPARYMSKIAVFYASCYHMATNHLSHVPKVQYIILVAQKTHPFIYNMECDDVVKKDLLAVKVVLK